MRAASFRVFSLCLVALLALGGTACSDGDKSHSDGSVQDGDTPDGGGGGNDDQGGQDDQGGTQPECGNGVREGTEECDGADRDGATCASEMPSTPVGQLGCTGCELVTSDCRAPTADDGDAESRGR